MRLGSLAAVGFLLMSLSACGGHETEAPTHPATVIAPTVVARSIAFPTIDSVPGSIVSDQRINLSSRVVGFIQSLDVQVGDPVERGQVLVRIAPADIDAGIHQAQAGVAVARAELADAEQDAGLYSDLSQTGAVGGQDARKAAVRRDVARAGLERANAVLASAVEQRRYITIVSPIDGIVVRRDKRAGEMAVAGAPLLTVESRQSLLMKIFVPEDSLARLHKGARIRVVFDARPGLPVHGIVQDIVLSGDPLTRRYEVNIALPQDPALLPGMFGRTEIPFGAAPAVVVPAGAIVDRGGLQGVFVVGPDNVARFRWLRTGRETDEALVEVVSGLAAGERILARGDATLADGTIVHTGGSL